MSYRIVNLALLFATRDIDYPPARAAIRCLSSRKRYIQHILHKINYDVQIMPTLGVVMMVIVVHDFFLR